MASNLGTLHCNKVSLQKTNSVRISCVMLFPYLTDVKPKGNALFPFDIWGSFQDVLKEYTRLDKIRNEVIRKELEISGIQDVRSKHKQNWINYFERMDNARLPKHALNYKPRGRKDRGRPRKRRRNRSNDLIHGGGWWWWLWWWWWWWWYLRFSRRWLWRFFSYGM